MNRKVKHLILETKKIILGFIDKELTLFAASLSFYTIFTIIPLLMIVMMLITSLPSFNEHYETIKHFIFSNLMPVNSQAIMNYIDSFLKNSVKLGVVGFASVIIASMLFFQNFEYIVNRIFHAKKRTVWESVTTYWTLITLTPIALGVSFYISGKLALIVDESILSGWINVLKIFPYLIIWALFFLIYQIAANIKIEPKASFIASFITSTIFSIAKSAFIYYVVYNKTYATMYGSFAMVVFLFFWIYVSWIIFIYGMKLCYILNRVYQEKKGVNTKEVKKEPVAQSEE